MFNGLEITPTECSVCFETIDINKKVTTDCNHTFCNTCFFKWMQTNTTCPICRKSFVSPFMMEEIEKQQNILDELIYNESQVREFNRIGIIEYDKREKQLKKLEELCKKWTNEKRKLEIERGVLEIDIEALKTSLTTEKKMLRNNYKKEWNKLHHKQSWWKKIVKK
mgnify:CR=1 FL=1|jgi:hypothetical protein|tara:strand:+ start:3635 stop:4132 length:498 start_codon:yes stop_codon:yes gene_type:complete